MGHYLSEMLDPSPINTTKVLKGKSNLKLGKKIMKHRGHWKKGSICYEVTYHKMKRDHRGWYEIHCKNKKGGLYFITVTTSEWDNFRDTL